MDLRELIALAVTAAVVAIGLYLQVRFGGEEVMARFRGLQRICQGCEQPLARPRPKSCPHCGTKVKRRWL